MRRPGGNLTGSAITLANVGLFVKTSSSGKLDACCSALFEIAIVR
jgi:hypothetical protein